MVGTILLTATTYRYPAAYALSMSSKEGFLAVSLILISIGVGGIKANVSPMGADQLKDEGEHMVQRFFDCFYWFIQVGSLLAFTIVVYVQQEVSFFYGYLITAISMVVLAILLLIGRNYLTLYSPKRSYLTHTLRIICGGLKHKLCCKKTPVLAHWLDGAKMTKGGKFSEDMVEGVKSVVRLMPIFLAFIFYWTIYGQVRGTSRLSLQVVIMMSSTNLTFIKTH